MIGGKNLDLQLIPVRFRDAFIDEKDIKDVFEELQPYRTSIDNNQGQGFLLDLEWSAAEIVDIDIALFGYLGLLHSEYPKLQTRLVVKGRARSLEDGFRVNDTAEQKILNKLRSYYSHFVSSVGPDSANKFQVYRHGVVPIKGARQVKEVWSPIRKRDLQVHETIIPSIPIGEFHVDFFELLFRSTLGPLIGQSTPTNAVHDPYVKMIRETYSKLKSELGWTGKFDWKEGEFAKSGRIQGFGQKSNKKRYTETVVQVVEDLEQQPPIYLLIFYVVMVNSGHIKSRKTLANKKRNLEFEANLLEESLNLIKNQWFFSKDIAAGVVELAKNVVTHTPQRRGIFCLRFYDKQYLDNEYGHAEFSQKAEEFAAALDQRKYPNGLTRGFFDINVFDLGKESMVESLLKSTERAIEKITSKTNESISLIDQNVMKALYLGDQKLLSSGDFVLAQLFDPNHSSLHQQRRRSIAHLGLMALSSLVENNGGKIAVASGFREKRQLASWDLEKLLFKIPDVGTFIKLLIPAPQKKEFFAHKYKVGKVLKPLEVKGFAETLKIYKENFVEVIPEPIRDANQGPKVYEQLLAKNIISSVNCLAEQSPEKDVVLLNFRNHEGINESQLFRLIPQLSIIFPDKNFLISCISETVLNKFIRINYIYYQVDIGEENHFWSEKRAIIFYSFKETYRTESSTNQTVSHREFVTDALWGKSFSKFFTINKMISSSHSNSVCDSQELIEIYKLPRNQEDSQNIDIAASHKVFLNHRTLLPLDALIQTENYTLFEHNAKRQLSKNLITKDNNQQGFTISGSHFKIGSKLHVDTFYYVKRFFQNNNYCSRFAILLAQDIAEQILQNEDILCGGNTDNGLSIIGYEFFSEMLLTLTVNYLQVYFDGSHAGHGLKINSNIVSMVSNQEPVLKNETIHRKLVIVTPIASTFSTSVKIYETLKKINPEIEVIKYYNLLFTEDSSKFKVDEHGVSELEKSFNWVNHNPSVKQVTVQHTHDNQTSVQNYNISLPSKWSPGVEHHDLEHCKECFPEDAKQERALFETDHTAVTPSIIFQLPSSLLSHWKFSKRRFVLTDDHINYGHHEREDTHYLFEIKIKEFLQANEKLVSDWLHQLYTSKALAEIDDNIILVADHHHTNMKFIEMVNEKLFLSTARIIHYDSSSDHVENFSKLYSSDLEGAHKIYFVDDAIMTGQKFSKVNYFVQNALLGMEDRVSTTKINGCITLINKLQAHDLAWLESKMITPNLMHATQGASPQKQDVLYSFAYFNLYSSTRYDQQPPIVYEVSRYRELALVSFLCAVEQHFLGRGLEKSSSRMRKTRPSYMLWATHYIFEYFSRRGSEFTELGSWSEFSQSVKSQIHSVLLDEISDDENGQNFDEAILKTLTQSPFIQYHQVKEKIFPWVVELAIDKLDWFAGLDPRDVTDQQVSDLKFFIRRATAVNSNLLLSKSGLLHDTLFTNVFSLVEQSSKVDDTRFDVFLVAQLKELMLRDPMRCIKLEAWLRLKLEDDLDPNCLEQRILRMLYLENALYLSRTYEFISRYLGVQCFDEFYRLYSEKERIPTLDEFSESVISTDPIVDNFRYANLENFLNESPVKCHGLLNYFWLRSLINFESNDKAQSLSDTTECIVEGIKSFLWNETPEVGKTPRASLMRQDGDVQPHNQEHYGVGSFLQVKSVKQEVPPMFIYDKDCDGRRIFEHAHWNRKQHTNFVEFLSDEVRAGDSLQKSIFELVRNDEKAWFDRYDGEEIKGANLARIPDEYDRLILMAIWDSNYSPMNKEGKTPRMQGMLGLYFSSKLAKEKPIKVMETIRYMLLLRRSLSAFIQRHHENDEFIEWQLAEQRKWYTSVHGHGKYMLKRFIQNKKQKAKPDTPFDGLYDEILMNVSRIRRLIFTEADSNDVRLSQEHREYVTKTSDMTLSELKSHYAAMAKDVIENKAVELGLSVSDDYEGLSVRLLNPKQASTTVKFQKYLLDIVMFELLVNAKKNRWISFPIYENRVSNSEVAKGATQITTEVKNKLEIEVSYFKDQHRLAISIINSGQKIDPELVAKLNKQESVKAYPDEIAGTVLIWNLLQKYFEPSGIGRHELNYYESVAADDERPYFLNRVTLLLSLAGGH